MRQLHLSSLVLISYSLLGQAPVNMPIDSTSKRVTYEAVFDAPGSAHDLFERTEAWFKKYYPNPSAVIKSKDESIGKIEGTHQFALYIEDKKGTEKYIGSIKYDIKTWVKEGMVRYMLTNIRVEHTIYYGIERWMDPTHDDAANNPKKLEKIDAFMNDLVANFRKFMTTIEQKKSEDDW